MKIFVEDNSRRRTEDVKVYGDTFDDIKELVDMLRIAQTLEEDEMFNTLTESKHRLDRLVSRLHNKRRGKTENIDFMCDTEEELEFIISMMNEIQDMPIQEKGYTQLIECRNRLQKLIKRCTAKAV